MKVSRMSHWAVAKAQVIISILFVMGFFGAVTMQGLGYFKIDVVNNLKEMLMLVLSFWFMRQRVSGDDPSEQPHPHSSIAVSPTMPPPGAAKIVS